MVRAFNRLVIAAFVSILFITLATIFGYFISVFSYGAQILFVFIFCIPNIFFKPYKLSLEN